MSGSGESVPASDRTRGAQDRHHVRAGEFAPGSVTNFLAGLDPASV
jgi:hypothetical protein